MIVCLCRGLRDHEIDAAIRAGADSCGAVFRHVGLQPNCGLCFAWIRDQLATQLGTLADADLQAAD